MLTFIVLVFSVATVYVLEGEETLRPSAAYRERCGGASAR